MTNNNVRGDKRSQSALTEDLNWVGNLKRVREAGPGLDEKSFTQTGDSTKAVHAGTTDDPRTGAVGTPIYQTSTFLLDEDQYQSIEEGHARDRFIYTRYGNPNQWAVQQKIAALENAESALVFSSGMAAITAAVMALVDRGGHVVASNELYGGTHSLFNSDFPNWGMSTTYVDPKDFEAIEAAIQPNTQVLYFEALTNPLLKLTDLEKLVALGKKHNLRVIIDATFVTPISCRPLDWGVDLVVHSASKYLNGHSDLIAGVVVGSRKLVDMVWPKLLNFGGNLDPHASYLLERGLKTLSIRMKAHEESAYALAQYLENHKQIKQVIYPKLASYPDAELALKQLKLGGGMISFVVDGGDQAALNLLKHLKYVKSATSLGGVESLVSLPFNSSQASFTSSQREKMGIYPGCVRLSVGIEDPQDLINDFEQALAKIAE
ncbi:trans-sulfuration enzyme family protein [Aliikangiella maris]|uniref:PLP-dependent aspartate aminotransferase family protein n=2 Tax=Aliikangiella maris TaxID=3162458 RepID=A0ABV3MRS5_9GAMM